MRAYVFYGDYAMCVVIAENLAQAQQLACEKLHTDANDYKWRKFTDYATINIDKPVFVDWYSE